MYRRRFLSSILRFILCRLIVVTFLFEEKRICICLQHVLRLPHVLVWNMDVHVSDLTLVNVLAMNVRKLQELLSFILFVLRMFNLV